MKYKGFMFPVPLLLLAIILLSTSCRDEVAEEPVVYNDKIDGVAVSTLPPLDESMAKGDTVPSYRNTTAFEGALAKPSSSFEEVADNSDAGAPPVAAPAASAEGPSDPNFS